MLDFLKNFFTTGPKIDYKALVADGAQIIDVRSKGEFKDAHLDGSINIPLQSLAQNLTKISRDKPIIVCCASGMRSRSAKGILSSNGYTEVHNAGSWNSLQAQI